MSSGSVSISRAAGRRRHPGWAQKPVGGNRRNRHCRQSECSDNGENGESHPERKAEALRFAVVVGHQHHGHPGRFHAPPADDIGGASPALTAVELLEPRCPGEKDNARYERHHQDSEPRDGRAGRQESGRGGQQSTGDHDRLECPLRRTDVVGEPLEGRLETRLAHPLLNPENRPGVAVGTRIAGKGERRCVIEDRLPIYHHSTTRDFSEDTDGITP
jgi:hypothetical protein